MTEIGKSGDIFKCGHCGYEGPCYGTAHSAGISAPWCYRCGMNDKLAPIKLCLKK